MLTKLRCWGIAFAGALLAGALAVGFLFRHRAESAADKIRQGREKDAEQRGRDAAARARLKVIDGELKFAAPPAEKRTPAEALEELRRRGQVIE